MANKEQLNILKQGVEVWNQWREDNPDEEIDLYKADLSEIDLSCINLSKANLHGTDLYKTNLSRANLSEADLSRADLFRADLSGANLTTVDLQDTTLIHTSFREADITGAKLYGSERNDWDINNILCNYVFWDVEGKYRTPNDRAFKPGEFEERYKHLPAFEYYFEKSFTPVDIVIMDQVVQTINQQNPEYEVKLTTLDSRGQPHAVFTVISKDYVEPARKQITTDYEARLSALEGKQEQMIELFARVVNNPQLIVTGDLTIGDKRMIQTGRDYFEDVDGTAQISTGNSHHNDQQKTEP